MKGHDSGDCREGDHKKGAMIRKSGIRGMPIKEYRYRSIDQGGSHQKEIEKYLAQSFHG